MVIPERTCTARTMHDGTQGFKSVFSVLEVRTDDCGCLVCEELFAHGRRGDGGCGDGGCENEMFECAQAYAVGKPHKIEMAESIPLAFIYTLAETIG